MKYILVREGDRTPSLFGDFTTVVNPDELPQIGFYHRVEPGLRLVRNNTRNGTSAFAIAHYQTDPSLRVQHPSYFRPIDLDLITTALDKYEYVIFGVLASHHITKDTEAIEKAQYFARTADGVVIDIETNLPIESKFGTMITAFFGAVRFAGFPVYSLILNSDLVHATDGFDFYDVPAQAMWFLLSEKDGPLCQHFLIPTIEDPARVIGNVIITTQPTFTLSFLTSPISILKREDPANILANAQWTVDTNLQYTTVNGSFVVATPAHGIGYFEIQFHCGLLFDQARPTEHPTFKYVVLNNENNRS
jgi:hypothetical protein